VRADLRSYDYAVIRVVPRVDGVLAARIELDESRLLALDPHVDLATVHAHLATIPAICAGGSAAGPLGALSRRERFDWLTAPRSSLIQTSPVHTGRCGDRAALLEHLIQAMVRTPRAAGR
jgi:hypothetical protein